MLKISKGTIIRTAFLILTMVNTSLQLMGWSVLPFGEDQLETFISLILNIVAGGLVYWNNNSISPEAIEADQYLKELKKNPSK